MDLTSTLIAACLVIVGVILLIFVSKRPSAIPVAFFFVSAFYLLFDSIPLPTFKGSGINYIDVLCLFLLCASLIHLGFRRFLNVRELPKTALALWLLFIPPLIIGFFHDYNFFTILRDGRVLLYYGMVFPLYFIFIEHPHWLRRCIRGAYLFTALAVITYFLLMAFNIRLYKGRSTYDYQGSEIYTWWGIHSWIYLYLFAIFYLFPRLVLRLEKRSIWAMLFFLLFNAVLLGLLIRTMFLGWVAGLAFLVILLSQRFKQRALVWGVSALAILAAILIANIPVDSLRGVTVVARYGSLINPDLKYKAAEGTARVRYESLEQFEKNEGIYYVLGEGFGDPSLSYAEKRDKRRLERMAHSGWGWMLARMGVLGSAAFASVILVMVLRRRRSTVITEGMVTELSLRTFVFAMVIVAFGSNVLFFENFTVILVVLAIAALEATHHLNQKDTAWLETEHAERSSQAGSLPVSS